MFKGFRGTYVGADIDHELLTWVSKGLPWVQTAATEPRKPLPFRNGQFDGVISISVFTHMNQADCLFYLRELHRVTRPGAYLFLTVHGSRALERAENETSVFEMLQIPASSLQEARAALDSDGVQFVRQDTGHLTTESYDYGITFTAEGYVRAEWARLFSVKDVRKGAIHDFQDIVVLKRVRSRPAILERVRRLFD
jgi:SAM-dependent methyltransferase